MGPPKRKGRSLGQQVGSIRGLYPDWSVRMFPGGLVASGQLQPTPLSTAYRVSIRYRIGDKRPEATVEAPPLQDRGSQSPPHIFPGRHPCLHLPAEWNGDLLISRTTIPWLAEWLVFYELWLATGEWLGEGRHPPAETSAAKSRRGLQSSKID